MLRQEHVPAAARADHEWLQNGDGSIGGSTGILRLVLYAVIAVVVIRVLKKMV